MIKKPKNIVLCADGTGNRGGYTPDSNVYEVYKTVERNLQNVEHAYVSEQILFCDNGIGTSGNKIVRTISGAFGFGFSRNVRELYRFLAYNRSRKTKHELLEIVDIPLLGGFVWNS